MAECHTWIDVIFIDDDDIELQSKTVMPTFLSRHNLIDVELILNSPDLPSSSD